MEKTGLPVNQDLFLEAGVHIGTRIKTNDMKQFIFKKRDDGLFILDLRKTADRLMAAAKMIAKYPAVDVLVVASRVYSGNAAAKFSRLTNIPVLQGRFVPGTTTNLAAKQFCEPRLIFVCDPKGEREAIMEGAKNGVPIIALCDTDNETKFIDLIIPINNKGRRSLALVFYILAREIMLSQGAIKSYDEFKYDLGYFERLEEIEKPKAEEEVEAPISPKPAEKPAEKAVAKEKPKVEPKAAEKPAAKVEKKAEKPAEKPVEHKPAAKDEKKPAEKPAEKPAVKEKPKAEKPAEHKPAAKEEKSEEKAEKKKAAPKKKE
ncbi:MAG: 30S ribosomal protein S2 [Candidatus Micrarchaeota archaeon]